MANQASIEGHITRGSGIAARVLGVSCPYYRPQGANAAISSGNLLGTINAAFSVDAAFTFGKPPSFAKPEFYGLFDRSALLAGDYINEPFLGPFFLCDIEPLKPQLCIRCNRTLSGARPGKLLGNADGGINPGYGGASTGTEKAQITAGTALFEQWPASLLAGTKGEIGAVRLPSDPKSPWWAILLPPSLPVSILFGDSLYDETGRKYTVSSSEQSALGWRLTAVQDVA